MCKTNEGMGIEAVQTEAPSAGSTHSASLGSIDSADSADSAGSLQAGSLQAGSLQANSPQAEQAVDPLAFTPRDRIVFQLGALKAEEEQLTAHYNALTAQRAQLCEQLKR